MMRLLPKLRTEGNYRNVVVDDSGESGSRVGLTGQDEN